ncbi:hypothetical protein P8452_74072 [Trifolium repens]|nr:hypothetical protein P8452_74072 [Trifolium repens]
MVIDYLQQHSDMLSVSLWCLPTVYRLLGFCCSFSALCLLLFPKFWMLLTLIIQHIIEKLFLILLKDYIEIIDVDFIDILANKTNEIALEHRPDDVGEDDWKFLVDYFSSPNYKVISERNKLNKAKQVINHRCGRKSFQVVSYDARDPETQKEPNYQDLWRMTHTNSNGEWIYDDSKEVHTKVQERCSELLELGYMDEDKDKLTNTAFEAVVGVRSGYSRGLGAGIKPQKGKNIAGLHEELKKECEKR